MFMLDSESSGDYCTNNISDLLKTSDAQLDISNIEPISVVVDQDFTNLDTKPDENSEYKKLSKPKTCPWCNTQLIRKCTIKSKNHGISPDFDFTKFKHDSKSTNPEVIVGDLIENVYYNVVYCGVCTNIFKKNPHSYAVVSVGSKLDEEFFKFKNPSNANTLKCEYGGYTGCSGNSAKKAATRKWRKIRRLIKEKWDGVDSLISDHNNENRKMIELITANSSCSKLAKKIENLNNGVTEIVHDTEVVPVFLITLRKKMSRIFTPPRSDLNFKVRNKFFAPFVNGPLKKRQMPPKLFNYVCIMTRQNDEKIKSMQKSNTLLKMGKEIWIANIYSVPKDFCSVLIPKDQLDFQNVKISQLKRRRDRTDQAEVKLGTRPSKKTKHTA